MPHIYTHCVEIVCATLCVNIGTSHVLQLFTVANAL